jgi:hypothetical protein
MKGSACLVFHSRIFYRGTRIAPISEIEWPDRNKGAHQSGRRTRKKNSVKEIDDTLETEEIKENEGGDEDEGKRADDDKENKNVDMSTHPTNEVIIPPMDEGTNDGKSISTLSLCPNVAEDGKLTVIQKSKLMNWAEEHFLRANKIMTFEEVAANTKLHEAICRAIGLKDNEWAVVGAEAIKKLRSAMSD